MCVVRWRLTLGTPYEQSFVSVVFPATLGDGSAAVLKLQFPHDESEHEAEALRRWRGEGAVRLLGWDVDAHALLIERCEPGDHLSGIGADAALEVLITLLPRLWIPAASPFTSLSDEAARWRQGLPASWQAASRPFEIALLDTALEALDRLPRTQGTQVLLHQDLHGDNVLRATREPWLVIDPKPLVGEREFSLAPVIRSYEFGHGREEVVGRLDRLSTALGLDRERVRLWSLAQTLAWAFDESRANERHIETARWLWQA
jgi:streptomycin 6-kinase